jgi:hypothetical protein
MNSTISPDDVDLPRSIAVKRRHIGYTDVDVDVDVETSAHNPERSIA